MLTSTFRRSSPSFALAGAAFPRLVVALFTVLGISFSPATAIVAGEQTTGVAATGASNADRKVMAYVAGRPIYLDDLDRLVRAQLLELEEQTYRLRRNALENEIDRILIETLASSKGVEPSLVRRELAASRLVTDSEVDGVFEKGKARFATVSESDAKDRIRETLQRELQRRAYREKLVAMRDDAKVEILLSRPRISQSEFQKLSGPSLGASDPNSLRVVVFSDYQCPYCRRAEGQLAEVQARYPDKVQVVYKQFPLGNHPQAQKAAEAALCANEQGAFRQYHALLFPQSADLSPVKLKDFAKQVSLDQPRFDACLDSGKMAPIVTHDVMQGHSIGVAATPTIVVDGELLRGLPPPGELDAAVQRALRARTLDKVSASQASK